MGAWAPSIQRVQEGIVRIRGQIGDWPVDLTIELEPEEWARLGRLPEAQAPTSGTPAAPVHAVRQDDGNWQAARDLLRSAGQISGPQLLEQLEGLAGSAAAAKRLLVRLRHAPEVKVESAADAPLYHWTGPEGRT